MERLTVPDDLTEGGKRRAIIDARAVRAVAMSFYWALKKYEDTGLTPEEIMDGGMLVGWIPVTERLPGKYEVVLATVKTEEDEESLVYEGALGAGWNLCGAPNPRDYKVTAWMPLPKPYKEDGEWVELMTEGAGIGC